jgi:hypothetical protein
VNRHMVEFENSHGGGQVVGSQTGSTAAVRQRPSVFTCILQHSRRPSQTLTMRVQALHP